MRRFHPQRVLRTSLQRVVLLAALFTVLLPAVAMANGALSEGFTTTETSLPVGTLLSYKSDTKGVVDIATLKSQTRLLGVVGNNTLVALGGGKNQVQAVVTGLAPVLVSDINGPVKSGDSLAVSPIAGVAMKATASGMVIGIAQGTLSQAKTSAHSVKDATGKQQMVHVGLLNAQVDITFFAPPEDKIKPLLPSFLVSVGRTIAGKDISGMRVVISLVVLLLGFVTVVVILQAGIRSGIIAIGRNPLAHGAIRRSLVDVTVTGLVLLILTVMAVYVILTI